MMDYYPTIKRPQLLKLYTIKQQGRKFYAVAAYSLAEAFQSFGKAGVPEVVQHISRIYPVNARNMATLSRFSKVIANPGRVHLQDGPGNWVPFHAV